MQPADAAIASVSDRAARDRSRDRAAVTRALDGDQHDADAWVAGLFEVARLTLNFHPDRISRGRTVAAGLHAEGRYHGQRVTRISNGSRSAVPGGDRTRWETELFGPVYEHADPAAGPCFGSLDLLHREHGGSPGFGSCFLVLAQEVIERTTLCIGDSHLSPTVVGTRAEPWGIAAALLGQAAAGDLLGSGLSSRDLRSIVTHRRAPGGERRVLTSYVEAQVHGGVDLRRDVVAAVIDPSFRGTPVASELEAGARTHGYGVRWHAGSELEADAFPGDFRGPHVVDLAPRVANDDGLVDAAAIGRWVPPTPEGPGPVGGDPQTSPLQAAKHLWQTTFVHGHAAGANADSTPTP